MQAAELSAKLIKYTRREEEDDATGKGGWYWPLVNCVTIRVPNDKLLQHVTLVDLPGNGDCNKGRDEMWKKVINLFKLLFVVFYCATWKL